MFQKLYSWHQIIKKATKDNNSYEYLIMIFLVKWIPLKSTERQNALNYYICITDFVCLTVYIKSMEGRREFGKKKVPCMHFWTTQFCAWWLRFLLYITFKENCIFCHKTSAGMHLANKGKNSGPVFHNTFMKGFEATNTCWRRKMKKMLFPGIF